MLKVGLSVNEQLFHKEHVAAMKQALMDAGYQGVWMYELGLLPPKTIQRRELTYTDFYRNAQEIMTGCCPTPIGTRVEGLSSWK